MQMTRKEFCSKTLGGTVLLLFQAACGGGDGPYGGSPAPAPGPAPSPAPAECGASGAAIAGNHGHVLEIPAADLDAAVAMSYSIAGTAGHDHRVTFSPAQLQMLKSGGEVTVVSTATDLHDHSVRASCP